MNDWSRLAVDPKDDAKNSEPKSQLQEYKYAPDQAVLGTCYQEAWAKTNAPSGEVARTTPFVLDKYLS